METMQRTELLKVVLVGWTLVRDDAGVAHDLEGTPLACYTKEELLAAWDKWQLEVAQANLDNPMPNRQQRRSRRQKEAT